MTNLIRYRRLLAVALGLALALAGVACDDKAERTPDPSGASDLPQGDDPVELDPADFTTDIDNPYFPLEPGTRFTYREVEGDGAEFKVVVIVTTETKEIANGVTARVVRDTVTEEGAVVEDTFDWYAQDSEGNVWYMGEETAEFEDAELYEPSSASARLLPALVPSSSESRSAASHTQ